MKKIAMFVIVVLLGFSLFGQGVKEEVEIFSKAQSDKISEVSEAIDLLDENIAYLEEEFLSAEDAITEMQQQRYQNLLAWRNIANENLAELEYNHLLSTIKEDIIPDIITSLHVVEIHISKIEEYYDDFWEKQKKTIEDSYQPKFDAINELKPKIWETDKEFEQRLHGLRLEVQAKLDSEINTLKSALSLKEQDEKYPYLQLQQLGLSNLAEKRIVSSEFIRINPQEYQRNERRWSFLITSNHPIVKFSDLEVVVDFNELLHDPAVTIQDIRQAVLGLDEAVRTDNITFDVIWSINREEEKYLVEVSSIISTNLIDGSSHQFQYPKPLIASAYYVEGTNLENVEIIQTSPITDIKLLNQPRLSVNSVTQLSLQVLPTNVSDKSLNFSIEDTSLAIIDDYGIITTSEFAGETVIYVSSKDDLFSKQFPLSVVIYSVLDIGPAGGLIFYDKGFYSDGWRYLESAPYGWYDGGEDPSLPWGGYRTSVGGTGTAVGRGKTNTERIVSIFGTREPYRNRTDYPAKVCADYSVTVDGFIYDDWFLPSKDELNLMCENLHKQGNGKFSTSGYWSSSEHDANNAWHLYFFSYSSLADNIFKFSDNRVRPIRSF